METGDGACRSGIADPPTRCRRSSERMIPADRITDGIVYRTHFADWEKLAEPVSSAKSGCNSCWSAIVHGFYPFLHPSFCRLRHSGKSLSIQTASIDFRPLILFRSRDNWIFRYDKEDVSPLLSYYFQDDWFYVANAWVYFINIK